MDDDRNSIISETSIIVYYCWDGNVYYITTQRTEVRTLNYAKKSGHNGNGEVETGVQRCSRSVSRE
jgi:hypothetical protein